MKTRRFFPLIALLAFSLACNLLSGNSAPPPAPTQAPSTPQDAEQPTSPPAALSPTLAPTSPPATQPPTMATTSPPAAAFNGEVVDLATFAQDYRIHILATWQPEGGNIEQNEITIEHTSDPLVDRSIISSPVVSAEIYQTEGQSWMCSGGNCFSIQDSSQVYTTPLSAQGMGASYFNNPDIEVQELGRDTINGIEATHYRTTIPAAYLAGISQGQVSNIQSEAWVSTDSRYPPFVVRGEISWDEVREQTSGHGTLVYEVLEVNTGFSIPLPEGGSEGGQSATGDVPVYPNAEQNINMGGTMMYVTGDDMQTVSAFYGQELAAQGWTMSEDNSIAGTIISQTWTKGDQRLTLTIATDESSHQTSIIIILE